MKGILIEKQFLKIKISDTFYKRMVHDCGEVIL